MIDELPRERENYFLFTVNAIMKCFQKSNIYTAVSDSISLAIVYQCIVLRDLTNLNVFHFFVILLSST